jgi:electron transfer flavoprotein beta subunit
VLSSEPPDRPAAHASGRDGHILVAVKPVELRLEIDPLTGVAHPQVSDTGLGLSAADEAAVEVALRLAEQMWSSRGVDAPPVAVEAVCVTPHDPSEVLRGLLARGVASARWVRSHGWLPSPLVGEEVAAAAEGAALVVCGDYSMDRGSGSVPSFAAARLGWAGACGLRELSVAGESSLLAVRRLDGGRREDLSVPLPAVVSVEAGNYPLRRASLRSLIAARSAEVVAVSPAVIDDPSHGGHGIAGSARAVAFRPPTKAIRPPESDDALGRIVEVTGSLSSGETARTVHASPEEAAVLILDQLRSWGYLGTESETLTEDPAPAGTAQ